MKGSCPWKNIWSTWDIMIEGWKNILIADDSLINRKSLAIPLQKQWFNVIEVENWAEALEIIFKQRADFVLMDISMPVMDWIEATLEIRKRWYDTPIIWISAVSYYKDQALDSWMDHFLNKPVNISDILKLIIPNQL